MHLLHSMSWCIHNKVKEDGDECIPTIHATAFNFASAWGACASRKRRTDPGLGQRVHVDAGSVGHQVEDINSAHIRLDFRGATLAISQHARRHLSMRSAVCALEVDDTPVHPCQGATRPSTGSINFLLGALPKSACLSLQRSNTSKGIH